MRDGKGKHMDKDSRVAIEEGLYNGDSCRSIARAAGVSPSTVTREVRANRTVVERPRKSGARLAVRCARYRECEAVGAACAGCKTSYVRCKSCRTHSCIDTCPDFELAMCPLTGAWPHVCPKPCAKSSRCGYPRVRYRAEEAQASYEGRLSSSRSGIDLTEEELALTNSIVAPLVRQGHSFGSICASHAELAVCERTLYGLHLVKGERHTVLAHGEALDVEDFAHERKGLEHGCGWFESVGRWCIHVMTNFDVVLWIWSGFGFGGLEKRGD